MSSNPNEQMLANAVAVDDEATLIVAAGSPRRRSVVVRNVTGSDTVYIDGTDQVADTDGFPLAAGEAFRFDEYTGPVYAICATGETADVRSLPVG